jgi:hypothetical protein
VLAGADLRDLAAFIGSATVGASDAPAYVLRVAVPQLRADEMADIVAYLYDVRYFADRGSAAGGRELVAAKNCRTCHGAGGTAPDLTRARAFDWPAAVVAAMWNHLALAGRGGLPRPAAWPELRAGDLADLVALLRDSSRRDR